MTGLVGTTISKRESLEGILTSLGVLLAREEMVQRRTEIALENTGMHGLLDPALTDLQDNRTTIRSIQARIAADLDNLVRETAK